MPTVEHKILKRLCYEFDSSSDLENEDFKWESMVTRILFGFLRINDFARVNKSNKTKYYQKQSKIK